jgi:hypothetical protein
MQQSGPFALMGRQASVVAVRSGLGHTVRMLIERVWEIAFGEG